MTEKLVLEASLPAMEAHGRFLIPAEMRVSHGMSLIARLLGSLGELRVYSLLQERFLNMDLSFAGNDVQEGERILLL